MKRSLIAGLILVAVWATVFFVPSLNVLFRAQWQGNTLMSFTVWPAPWRDEIPDTALQPYAHDKNVLLLAALQLPRAKARSVSSKGWQPQDREEFYPSVLFPGDPKGTRHTEQLRRLEQSLQKAPNDIVLIATTLRAAMAAGGRLPESLSPDTQWQRASGPQLTAGDTRRMLALCERAQTLDPENSFFDLVRCILLFRLWQDKQGMEALGNAAYKPQFDEYVLQEMQRVAVAHEVILGRALTLEEKRELISWPSLPHTSAYKNFAELMAVHATKAARRGQHQKALHITELLAAMGIKMRQARFYPYLRYDMLEARGYSAPVFDELGLELRHGKGTIDEQQSAVFQAYALRHARPDLVAKAKVYYQERVANHKTIDGLYAFGMLGVPYGNWLLTELLWQISVLLLLYLPAPLLLCLVLGAMLCRKTEYDSEPLPVRNGWQCTWGCILSLVFIYALSLGLMVIFNGYEIDALTRTFFEPLYLFSVNKHDLTDVLWLPVIFATILAVHHAVCWQIRDEQLKVSWFARVAQFAVGITLGIIGWNIIFGEERVALGFLLAFSCAVLFYYYRQWRKRPHRRESVSYGLRLLYHSLVTWLVVGSVLYLCTLLLSLPLRQRAEMKVDRVLAVGEVRAIEME